MKRNSILKIAVLVIALGVVAAVVYYLWPKASAPQPAITSFETCASGGNAIAESYPRTCRDPASGKVYTETVVSPAPEAPKTMSFVSPKGVTIELNNWSSNLQVASPLTVSGRVPGSWSFEAQFAVILKDSTNVTLVQEPAKLQGDWMTSNLVPFTVTLEFTKPTNTTTGTLILQKSNPSDLPQNSDSVQVPVRF